MNNFIFVFLIVIFLFSCFIFPTFLGVKFFSKKISKKIYFFSFFLILSFYLFIFSSFFYIFYDFGNNLEQNLFYYSFISVLLFLIFGYQVFKILKFSFKKFVFFKIFLIFISVINILAFLSILKEYFTIFQVSGNSMNDSYFDKELVLVNKFDRNFENEEVVIFELSGQYYLKRILAKTNDKIMIENGKVFLQKAGNGDFLELEEKYLNKQNFGQTYGLEKKVLLVPEKSYFLLGDNRLFSTDSRHCFGNCELNNEFISEEKIVGKVFLDLGYFDFGNFRIDFSKIYEK